VLADGDPATGDMAAVIDPEAARSSTLSSAIDPTCGIRKQVEARRVGPVSADAGLDLLPDRGVSEHTELLGLDIGRPPGDRHLDRLDHNGAASVHLKSAQAR
jgi:hypothetical protein